MGLQPTQDDDGEEEDGEEEEEEEEEEDLTLWSKASLKVSATKVNQYKGDASGVPTIHKAQDGGVVELTCNSLSIAADGSIICHRGKNAGKIKVSDELKFTMQASSEDDDDEEEDSVSISYVTTEGKKVNQKVIYSLHLIRVSHTSLVPSYQYRRI